MIKHFVIHCIVTVIKTNFGNTIFGSFLLSTTQKTHVVATSKYCLIYFKFCVFISVNICNKGRLEEEDISNFCFFEPPY